MPGSGGAARAQTATGLLARVEPGRTHLGWMRRVVTHNHWFETLQAEIQALRDFFCYLAGRKEQVRQLCAVKTPESLLALL